MNIADGRAARLTKPEVAFITTFIYTLAPKGRPDENQASLHKTVFILFNPQCLARSNFKCIFLKFDSLSSNKFFNFISFDEYDMAIKGRFYFKRNPSPRSTLSLVYQPPTDWLCIDGNSSRRCEILYRINIGWKLFYKLKVKHRRPLRQCRV